MKYELVNYSYDNTTRKLSLLDYQTEGVGIRKLLAVFNITRNKWVYKVTDQSISTVAVSELYKFQFTFSDVGYNTGWTNGDEFFVIYADPNHAQLVQLISKLEADKDEVTAQSLETIPVYLSASGIAYAAACKILGVIVSDSSTGSIKLLNGTTSGGTTKVEATTFAVGAHDLFSAGFDAGCYAIITGTVKATFLVLPILNP